MKKQLKIAGISLFIIGLAVLLGYALYVGFMSGELLGEYTIQEFQGSVATLGGFTLSSGKSVTHSVGPLTLGPEMNPLRLILSVDRKGRGSTAIVKDLKYTFELATVEGKTVWKKNGFRSASGEKDADQRRLRLSLGAFDIEEKGEYMLYAALEDQRTIRPIITKATVTLRRNVARGQPWVYLTSGTVMLIGFVLMIVGTGKKKEIGVRT